MVLALLLLQLCASKIVVVDDMGVTDAQQQSPDVASKVANALESTVRNANDVVLLQNGKGMKRIAGAGPQGSVQNPSTQAPGPGSMSYGMGPRMPYKPNPQRTEYPYRQDPMLGGLGQPESMPDASRARRSFIAMKMAQSRQKESSLQNSIDKLLQEIDQISEKTHDTQRSRDAMLSRLHTRRNHLRNLQNNKKDVETQRGRTLALVRLARNEVLRLSKAMDNQRSKLALLEDEEKIFTDRVEKYEEEYDAGNRELQLDDAQMDEIKKNIDELEKIYDVLRSRSNELLNERNKESTARNKMELDMERLDRGVADFI